MYPPPGPPPGPLPGPPGLPPRPRRRWGLVPVVVAVVAGGVLLGSVVAALLADDDGVALEDRKGNSGGWDDRVVDLVEFVEDERGLEFRHPVQIDFLPEEEFRDELRADGDLDEEEVEEIEEFQDLLPMFRALGLLEGELDIFETVLDYQEEAVAAFYDPEEERVVVPTTEPTVADEVVLVHELTHALQDQHFDLEALGPDPDEEDDAGGWGVSSLVEGDANRIMAVYAATLPPSDLEDAYGSEGGLAPGSDGEVDDFPSYLVASLGVPYTLGQAMVQTIALEGGNEAVDAAFADPPSIGNHLLDARTYLDGRDAVAVAVPDVPAEAAEPLDDGDLDALDVYFILAQRIDFTDALDAADGSGGSTYAAYERADSEQEDARACVRLALTGVDDEDTERLRDAFDRWAEEAPEATDVAVDDEGDLVEVEACDPGAEAELADDRLDEALGVASMRSGTAWELVEYMGFDLDGAWDAAECIVDALLADDAFDFGALSLTDEDYATIQDAVLACADI